MEGDTQCLKWETHGSLWEEAESSRVTIRIILDAPPTDRDGASEMGW